jgi:hypothetical protein
MPAANDQVFLQNELAKWSEHYDFRQRIHTIRCVVPIAVGTGSGEVPLDLPSELPFLWTGIGWASNRRHDDLYCSLTLLATEQVFFLNRPTRLGAIGYGPATGPIPWGPAKLIKTDRFRAAIVRSAAIDAAETYPGVNVPSTIDLAMVGFDLLPKGSVTKSTQA